jgi:predicted hydrocarbon binding protein
VEILLEKPREVMDEEVYAKLIAMAAVGIEAAAAYTGGLANLAAKSLYTRLHPGNGGLEEALRWLNHNTVLRVRTYVVGESFVRDEGGEKAFYLIAYECPIRQILYLEDLPYGRTLCRVMCGYLERLFSEKLGGRYRVSLDRAGPNACLLRGVVRSPPEPPPDLRVDAEPISGEEYRRLLREALSNLLHAVSDALYTTLGGNVAMSYLAGKEYGRRMGAQILAEGYEAASLEEAVRLANAGLSGFIEVELVGDTLRIKWSRFHEIIEREKLRHPEFVERLVQGFLAGVLEELLGSRVELRSTSEPRVFKVMTRA